MSNAASRPTATRASRSTPDRAEAIPKAAPTPSSHQAAMPAYARVVGVKPPFAYNSAKTVAATAIPTAASRRSVLCAPFTLIQATGRYSNDHVQGAEPSSRGRPRGRCVPRRAVGRARRLRWGPVGAERLQGVRGYRRRRHADGRRDALVRPDLQPHLRAELEPGGSNAEARRQGPARSGLAGEGLRHPATPRGDRHERRCHFADRTGVGLRPRIGTDSSSHRAGGHGRPDSHRQRNAPLASIPPRLTALNLAAAISSARKRTPPHVLLVSYLFSPSSRSGAQRTAAFRNALEDLGVRTTVLTSTVSGPSTDDEAYSVARAKDARSAASLQGVVGSDRGRRWWSRLIVPDATVLSWGPAAAKT